MSTKKKRKSSEKISPFVELVTITGDTENKQMRKKKFGKKFKSKKRVGTQELTVLNHEFIPLTTKRQIRQNNNRNKKEKIKSQFIMGDENVSEDFIAFSTSLSSLRRTLSNDPHSIKGHHTVVSNSTTENQSPVTITVDDEDDDDDASDSESNCVCINDDDDSNDNDSINDSVQILQETVKSNRESGLDNTAAAHISMSKCKKRKFDESIEIYLETCTLDDSHTAKKARKTSSIGSESSSSNSSPIPEFTDSNNHQNGEEDDVVIVDTVDNNSRDSIMVVNDLTTDKVLNRSVRKRKKGRMYGKKIVRKNVRKNCSKDHDRSSMNIFVYQDGIGSSQNRVPHYKSPLLSIANKEADSDFLYHNIYGNNIYNPNIVKKSGLRPVIIDGSNVAYGHGIRRFSTRGILICINYFLKRGHWVLAFVPRYRRHAVPEEDRIILEQLEDARNLVFTPSRYLHGRRVVSYDDRFIVQCAAQLGGVIVSRDNFRDLVWENEAWRETIETRLLMFTWVGDILMFPDDPNGRNGPRLEEFLRFPK